jgi:pimeloyl-ACP methyl ester carboxylesterase
MPQTRANGISIEFDTFGDRAGEPLLLVMGLGAQMTRWNESFVARLVDTGHYVVRFDNRDIGLSHKFHEAGTPDLAQLMMQAAMGATPEAPYTLADMAADAVGLLDALELDSAHVCGASMGGMIAQTMAIDTPERVRSLTSIMSSTGNPELPPAEPEAMAALLSPPGTNRDEAIARTLRIGRIIGSPVYPADPKEAAARAARDYDRSHYPEGTARQLAAAIAHGNRKPRLASVTAPALVIHGDRDPLVPLAGGIDTHEAIPHSELMVVEGMGHDLPIELWPRIIDGISGLTKRAREAA